MKKVHGFSLVELITVMAVLAILSIGVVFYLRDASSGFVSTVDRDELVSTTRFALQRIAAEVRDALPRSIRTTGDCLEFLPVLAATHHLSLPTAAPASSLRAVPVLPVAALNGSRGSVPVGGDPYSLSAHAPVSPPVTVTGPDINNEITVSFAAPHRFIAESGTDRIYFVSDPVSICVDGTSLWRYEGYPFNVVQPTPASLPTSLPGRALLAEDVVPGSSPFTVVPPTLQRNAIVNVDLPLSRASTDLALNVRVQVRNVP